MSGTDGQGDVVKFGPETRRSPVVPILFTIPALILFWLAWDVAEMTRWQEPGIVAGMVLIGVVLLGIGFLVWRAEPFWQGRMRISQEGVALEQWKRNPIPAREVAWSEVAALRKRSMPRQPDFFGVELHGAREPRHNTVLWLSCWGLEGGKRDVIGSLCTGAERAGYRVERDGSWRHALLDRRWVLVSGPGDGLAEGGSAGPAGAGRRGGREDGQGSGGRA